MTRILKQSIPCAAHLDSFTQSRTPFLNAAVVFGSGEKRQETVGFALRLFTVHVQPIAIQIPPKAVSGLLTHETAL
eukprot:4310732-Prymnesium_polylepis.1